jgi:hypothetical protein
MSSPIFIKNPVVSTTGFIVYEVSAQFIATEFAMQECLLHHSGGFNLFALNSIFKQTLRDDYQNTANFGHNIKFIERILAEFMAS